MAITPQAVPLDPSIAFWLEMAEALAYADAYAAAAGRPGNPAGAVTTTIGGATAFAVTAVDVGLHNRVIGLGTTEPATEKAVESVSRFFIDNDRTRSLIHAVPHAGPRELARWLDARGYVPGARWAKVWHDLEALDGPDPQRRIDRIDETRASTFAEVRGTACGMPPEINEIAAASVGRPGWAHYVGYEGDTPVATGALRLLAGVAWIGYGATIEAHRGVGWQTAMLRRRLHDAREIGAWLAVSETSEETERDPVNHSFRNLLRTGFQPAYARRNWVRAPRG